MHKWLLVVLLLAGFACLWPERETLPTQVTELGVFYQRLQKFGFAIRLDYPENVEANVALIGDVRSWEDIPDRAGFLLAYHRTPVCPGKWWGLFADGRVSVIDQLPKWAGWSIRGTD